MPTAPAHWENAVTIGRATATSRRQRLSQRVVRAAIRFGLAVYAMTLRRRRPRAQTGRPVRALVTMTTHSDAWARAHLQPLAAARACGGVIAVTARPLGPIAGVEWRCPPRALIRTIGEVPARLLLFLWTAVAERPDLLAGFHLQMNGLAATWAARLIGARSAYFCVGGPREVIDGGVWSENRVFARLPAPDPAIERQLLDAVRATDVVIGMGTQTVKYFEAHGLEGRCHVVAGGIDQARFHPPAAARDLDVVFVGRLVPIKRVDLLLSAVRQIAGAVPELRVAIVGDGPLRSSLETLAAEFGIAGVVTFAGQQDDVSRWLQRAKIFMLTSESEGLSLSLMEAMSCGVAPVVADVGDLGDLVGGECGYLVSARTPEAFASPAIALLKDPDRLERVRRAAISRAAAYSAAATRARWEGILSDLERNDRS
jgi:glycosyltransferase involved in cell wall biosynthesis